MKLTEHKPDPYATVLLYAPNSSGIHNRLNLKARQLRDGVYRVSYWDSENNKWSSWHEKATPTHFAYIIAPVEDK